MWYDAAQIHEMCFISIFLDGVRAMCSSLGSILILTNIAVYEMQKTTSMKPGREAARVEQMKISSEKGWRVA
jgi:hypothetical protein